MVENGAVIVAAAFCPAPPLLHPRALASDGHDPVSLLRTACAQAVDRLLATEPDGVLVIGSASGAAVYGPGDAGGLNGYGIPVRLGFDGPVRDGAVGLALPHALGAWLLAEAGFAGQRLGLTADPDTSPVPLALTRGRWALLVMGDGSARRTEQSPCWYDPDAIPFDDQVSAALVAGEAQGLLDLDAAVGDQVMASGVDAWRRAGTLLAGPAMTTRLHYAEAPFGVLYLVASWARSAE